MKMLDTSKLKPCPFCGGRPMMGVTRGAYNGAREWYMAGCDAHPSDCAVRPCVTAVSEREAAAAWNKRAGEDRQ